MFNLHSQYQSPDIAYFPPCRSHVETSDHMPQRQGRVPQTPDIRGSIGSGLLCCNHYVSDSLTRIPDLSCLSARISGIKEGRNSLSTLVRLTSQLSQNSSTTTTMEIVNKPFFHPGVYQYLGNGPDTQFYSSSLPSPPLSNGSISPSTYPVGDLSEDPSSLLGPSPQPTLDSKLNSLYDIPLEQLVASLSAPPPDNSISVRLAGYRPERNPSWEQPATLPGLPTFTELSNPPPLPDLSTFPDLTSLLPTSPTFIPPPPPATLHSFPAVTCSSESLPPLMYPTSVAPPPTCLPPPPSTSPSTKPISFTDYSLPAATKSRAGPVRPERRSRTKFTPEQLEFLETEYQKYEFAVADRKVELAKETGVPPRTIALWFQNRRAKERRDQMKRNYSGES